MHHRLSDHSSDVAMRTSSTHLWCLHCGQVACLGLRWATFQAGSSTAMKRWRQSPSGCCSLSGDLELMTLRITTHWGTTISATSQARRERPPIVAWWTGVVHLLDFIFLGNAVVVLLLFDRIHMRSGVPGWWRRPRGPGLRKVVWWKYGVEHIADCCSGPTLCLSRIWNTWGWWLISLHLPWWGRNFQREQFFPEFCLAPEQELTVVLVLI
mmetsp:Transcript_54363/g.129543  ORF Transcript_54363/g.129543 Transcript_54363/m.129543 type:complete len:211 (+) Transcript_54363:110-742(+)